MISGSASARSAAHSRGQRPSAAVLLIEGMPVSHTGARLRSPAPSTVYVATTEPQIRRTQRARPRPETHDLTLTAPAIRALYAVRTVPRAMTLQGAPLRAAVDSSIITETAVFEVDGLTAQASGVTRVRPAVCELHMSTTQPRTLSATVVSPQPDVIGLMWWKAHMRKHT